MHLYCMRHGEACGVDIDPNQSLTLQGRQDVTAVAKFLLKNFIHVDRIVHSNKLRAKQTAEIIAEILSVTQISESKELLTEDSSLAPLTRMIASWDDTSLLVGHLPHIDQLVQTLLTGNINQPALLNFQPGSLACLKSCHHQYWLLDWMIHPQLVK